MAGMELNRPFLVIQIPFNFLRSPLPRRRIKKRIKFARSPNLIERAADIQKGWVVIASKCVFDLIFLDQFTRPVFICFDPI